MSYLLECRHMSGSHTGENISEFESILDEFQMHGKVFKTVTDNASNMNKAFADLFSLPNAWVLNCE